jgi:hypothetical protein
VEYFATLTVCNDDYSLETLNPIAVLLVPGLLSVLVFLFCPGLLLVPVPDFLFCTGPLLVSLSIALLYLSCIFFFSLSWSSILPPCPSLILVIVLVILLFLSWSSSRPCPTLPLVLCTGLLHVFLP